MLTFAYKVLFKTNQFSEDKDQQTVRHTSGDWLD